MTVAFSQVSIRSGGHHDAGKNIYIHTYIRNIVTKKEETIQLSCCWLLVLVLGTTEHHITGKYDFISAWRVWTLSLCVRLYCYCCEDQMIIFNGHFEDISPM